MSIDMSNAEFEKILTNVLAEKGLKHRHLLDSFGEEYAHVIYKLVPDKFIGFIPYKKSEVVASIVSKPEDGLTCSDRIQVSVTNASHMDEINDAINLVNGKIACGGSAVF